MDWSDDDDVELLLFSLVIVLLLLLLSCPCNRKRCPATASGLVRESLIAKDSTSASLRSTSVLQRQVGSLLTVRAADTADAVVVILMQERCRIGKG